jgi:hypothetical protein
MAKPEPISNEVILEALTAHPGVTGPELADILGIGQSTAAKRLAALELDSQVSRDTGGPVGGRRVPHRWSVLAPAPPPADKASAVAARSGATAPMGDATRLGRGVLGGLVLDYLAARPEENFGPAAIGKALDRSGGAVSNSLAAMAERGEVVLVSDKPRRYRIAASK